MNKDDILKFLKENKKVMEKRFEVSSIGLFGSYVHGRQNEKSDIDIIVSMPSSFDSYYDLKEYLEQNLHKEVDLGLEKSLRKQILNNIQDEIIYV